MTDAYEELTATEKDALWNNALFVTDTNVLLQLYDATEETATRQTESLHAIKPRLWIPHQVAHEYWLQRRDRAYDKIQVAQSFVANYRGFENTLKQRIKTLLAGVEAANRLAESLAEHLRVADSILEEITESAREQTGSVRDSVSALLDGRVGPRPQVSELKAYATEIEERFRLVRGPGYRDIDKDGYLRWMGDTLIWLQILSQAKAINKSVILCTNDSKDDWWFRTRSEDGKVQYLPHPSLIDEFRDHVGQQFWMYRSSQFYKELQRRKLSKPIATRAISKELDAAFFQTNAAYQPRHETESATGAADSAMRQLRDVWPTQTTAAYDAWLHGLDTSNVGNPNPQVEAAIAKIVENFNEYLADLESRRDGNNVRKEP